MKDIKETLKERKANYGLLKDNARITQSLLRVIEAEKGWSKLTDTHRETYHMIFHKISRSLCGDAMYPDNPHDIAGYATLLEKFLLDVDNNPELPFSEHKDPILKELISSVYAWKNARFSYRDHSNAQELFNEEWSELYESYHKSDTIGFMDAIGDILFLRVGQYWQGNMKESDAVVNLDLYLTGLSRHIFIQDKTNKSSESIYDKQFMKNFMLNCLSCVVDSNNTKIEEPIPKGNKYGPNGKGPNFISPTEDLKKVVINLDLSGENMILSVSPLRKLYDLSVSEIYCHET